VRGLGIPTNEDGTDKWILLAQDTRLIHLDIDPLETPRS